MSPLTSQSCITLQTERFSHSVVWYVFSTHCFPLRASSIVQSYRSSRRYYCFIVSDRYFWQLSFWVEHSFSLPSSISLVSYIFPTLFLSRFLSLNLASMFVASPSSCFAVPWHRNRSSIKTTLFNLLIFKFLSLVFLGHIFVTLHSALSLQINIRNQLTNW